MARSSLADPAKPHAATYWTVTAPFPAFVLEATVEIPEVGARPDSGGLYRRMMLPADAVVLHLPGGDFVNIDGEPHSHLVVIALSPAHASERAPFPRQSWPMACLQTRGPAALTKGPGIERIRPCDAHDRGAQRWGRSIAWVIDEAAGADQPITPENT